MEAFNEMIKKIGEELDIKVTLLSDGWTKVLEKNNQTHYITGYQFDLNNHGIGNIMDDKGLFFDLLKYKNIPVIEQYVIFKDYDRNKVIEYFNSNQKEIVVKANISNAGREVFKINDENELFKIIDKLLLSQYSVSLCPFYHIKNEYRVIILDNEVRLVFGKRKPIVIGNGKNSVKELAFKYFEYYKEHENDIINPNYIPKENEEIELNFKFNLSGGAKSFTDIPIELKEKIVFLAKRVTNLLNITFASVDVINTLDNQLLVLEANSGVTMNKFIIQNDNGYNTSYEIYRDAIKKMFNIND